MHYFNLELANFDYNECYRNLFGCQDMVRNGIVKKDYYEVLDGIKYQRQRKRGTYA
jgi:hypothetical protein